MTKKRNMWNILLASPFILAVLTCFIVNFALDRQFSWSLLTAASCLYAYLMLYTLIFGGKHRILFTYLVLAILLIPFLYRIHSQSLPPPAHILDNKTRHPRKPGLAGRTCSHCPSQNPDTR